MSLMYTTYHLFSRQIQEKKMFQAKNNAEEEIREENKKKK